MLTPGRTKSVWNLKQGSYQLGEPGEPGIFREKRLSLQVIREKVFFEEISWKNIMLSQRFFFTSVFVLCHSETLREWLAPLLLYGNLNYSVSMFLYFSIWFLITKNVEMIWCFDFCFLVFVFNLRCCLELG